MNSFFSWLIEHWPFGIWLVIICIVGYVVFKLTKYFSKTDTLQKEMQRKVDALPCEHHSVAIGKLDAAQADVKNLPCNEHHEAIVEMKGLKSTIESINEQVTTISKWIMHFDGDMIEPLAKKCSPRQMTSIGMKLFEVSKAQKTIDEHVDMLLSEMENRTPQTPFDVENVALDVLLAHMADPMFNDVKNYIYYQPETITLTDENNKACEVKISLNVIIRLMGINLRDQYLAKHTELSQPIPS